MIFQLLSSAYPNQKQTNKKTMHILIPKALLIECASPSANMCIVVCQQTGKARAAEALSAAYIIMYLLMLVTLVFYVTAAIKIVGYE